jgi:hypothetical protein
MNSSFTNWVGEVERRKAKRRISRRGDQIRDVETVHALSRCRFEDVRTPEVFAALNVSDRVQTANGRSISFGSH